MKSAACPCSGRSLARLVHPAVLAVLAHGDAHGYEIVQRLTELPAFSEQPPDHAGIYRMLAEMQRAGYVRSRWENPRSGPSRKVFRLTPSGRTCLREWHETLRTYRRELDDLMGLVDGSL